jgi:hypothetical protein
MNDRQQVLRVTNEEIRRVSADVGADGGEFVCECGSKECKEVIRLTVREFDAFCATADGTPLIAKLHR